MSVATILPDENLFWEKRGENSNGASPISASVANGRNRRRRLDRAGVAVLDVRRLSESPGAGAMRYERRRFGRCRR